MPVMEPAEQDLSRLESLPAELLEQIFLQSLNVNLPLASSHLSSMLSSTHTKAAVVSKIFSSARCRLEHVDELSHILWAGSASDTNVAISELQSRILACRWMTWDFMMICMENFFVRTLVREFRAQGLPWPEGLRITDAPIRPGHGAAPVQESVVHDFVHEWLRLDARKRLLNEDFREADENTVSKSLHQTFVWGPNDDTFKITLNIDSRTGVLELETKRGTDSRFLHWGCIGVRMGTIVPLKLLHGPWTGDKLSFIHALCHAGAHINLEKQIHREMTRKGLMEAIMEDNYRAVVFITHEWYRWSYDSSLPWMVHPDTKHLRVAVIERGCRRNIVGRLLTMGPLEIDPTVVSWAEEKKEQGDESGQWLLDQLEGNRLLGPLA